MYSSLPNVGEVDHYLPSLDALLEEPASCACCACSCFSARRRSAMVMRRSASAAAPVFLARTTATGLSSGVRTRPGTAVQRHGAEALRVQAGEPVAFAEELGPGQQLQGRVGEHEDDDEVGDGGQAQREREAADVADGHEVQHEGGEEVHGLGRQDGALGPLPAVFHGRDQAAAFAELIADAFEVDDERVGRLADGHDQAGDAGEGQPVVFGPAEDGDGQVRQRARRPPGTRRSRSRAPGTGTASRPPPAAGRSGRRACPCGAARRRAWRRSAVRSGFRS